MSASIHWSSTASGNVSASGRLRDTPMTVSPGLHRPSTNARPSPLLAPTIMTFTGVFSFDGVVDRAATDRMERNHRFLEEALELVQACGCTAKVERIRARHAAKPKYAPLPSAL